MNDTQTMTRFQKSAAAIDVLRERGFDPATAYAWAFGTLSAMLTEAQASELLESAHRANPV